MEAPIKQIQDAASPVLTEAERHQILVEWNRTEVDYPRDRRLHELIEEQAVRAPEAVAVVFEDRELTYRELNARANQLARHLQKLGVGPDTLVGICAERSLAMVVGLLGILKAGGAYVPLDPEYPTERLAFMLEDANVAVLLTQAHLVETLPPCAARLIRIVADWPAIAGESDAPVKSAVTAENLAYMIYTSGSTGRPKGAMNTHQGILNRLLWMQDAYQLTPADRVLQKTPFSFDVSVWEFFWPLLTGARLVVARPGGHIDPGYLAQLIAREKITTIHFVPSMLQLFLEQENLSDSCASLRRVICSGEALPMELQRRFFSVLGAELHNLYGPTEAAVDVTYWACERNSPLNTVPIGRPIANTQIYILDGQLQPVPVGVAGELHIGGVGLARGYHNRPELTAEKFIPDPFSVDPKARLYKTGDSARFLPDGNIEYLGRLDYQVKIRGFRVELGEIESVLARHPSIKGCAVLAHQDSNSEPNLVAYLVMRPGTHVKVEDLRIHLSQKLPDYMIPSRFMEIPAVPLNLNGKVDRKALVQLQGRELAFSTNYEAPRNERERQLVEIWQRLFQRENIGRQDNFFVLGGHSLLAARLVVEIEKLLGTKLHIAALFQSPTIESMAHRLARENWSPSWTSLVPLRQEGTRPPLYFVHGVGGDVYLFMKLTQYLAPDQPTYGLQAVGLDGKSKRHITVEEMAAHYVKEIVSFQSEGPFYLAGYSMGGVLAFEMARQIHFLGRRVALLALLDTAPEGPVPWVFNGLSIASYIPNRILHHFRHCWGLSRREWHNYLRGRCAALWFLMTRNRAPKKAVPAPLEGHIGSPRVPGYYDYYHAIGASYQLRPYPGTAEVFISDEVTPRWNWYWKHLARGGVSFHQIKGDHRDIIVGDNLREMANLLSASLERAQLKEQASLGKIAI